MNFLTTPFTGFLALAAVILLCTGFFFSWQAAGIAVLVVAGLFVYLVVYAAWTANWP